MDLHTTPSVFPQSSHVDVLL